MQLLKFFSGGIVPGTARANKALVLGSTKNIDTIDVAASGLKINGTAITATAAELNQVAGGNVAMTRAALAATGADAAGAAVIATQVVAVTASDNAKGVALPAASTVAGPILVINTVSTANLLVYPVSGGNDNINALAEDAAFTVGPGEQVWFVPTSATQWYAARKTAPNMLLGTVAVAADELAIPITARHVAKTTGADAEALTLANGAPGQRLTISLVVDGGGDGTLTPTTKTGFATIVFADAGDNVTLEFVDATVGWIIVGAAGVAAPPVISV